MNETKHNNKIIDVQEMLFKEMKRLDDDVMMSFANNRAAQHEFQRANALYNTSAGFIKTLNANLGIMDRAKKSEIKYDVLMEQLGMVSDEN